MHTYKLRMHIKKAKMKKKNFQDQNSRESQQTLLISACMVGVLMRLIHFSFSPFVVSFMHRYACMHTYTHTHSMWLKNKEQECHCVSKRERRFLLSSVQRQVKLQKAPRAGVKDGKINDYNGVFAFFLHPGRKGKQRTRRVTSSIIWLWCERRGCWSGGVGGVRDGFKGRGGLRGPRMSRGLKRWRLMRTGSTPTFLYSNVAWSHQRNDKLLHWDFHSQSWPGTFSLSHTLFFISFVLHLFPLSLNFSLFSPQTLSLFSILSRSLCFISA